MRTAIVTGATGYVGSHLATALIQRGWKVHAIVRSIPSSESLFGNATPTFHIHDGTTAGMISIFQQIKDASVVIHLASFIRTAHDAMEVEPMINANLLFATQLVEAMSVAGIKKLINTGTSWQHYLDEDYNPVCLYAATKQAFDVILKYYVEAKSLSVINLKLFDTYGPNDPRPKLFTQLRKTASDQSQLAMSPGEQMLDLVYIDDVIEAYLIAIERLEVSDSVVMEDYAVSSSNLISLREVAAVYSRIIDSDLPIQWGGRPYREREVMVPWSKGKLLPGWKPRVDLETGIRKMEDIHEEG